MVEKLYKLKDVAEVLRVSERSVFRYIHAGKLRATKIGYWRITEADLKQFLEKGSNLPKKK
jgi:excisionase family DNA binding protein